MNRWINADDTLEFLNLMYDNQEDKDDPYNVGVMGVINYIKHKALSIEIPPMPKGDMIGYKWKLKWVLESHPTITKVLMQGADDESS